MPPSLLLFVLLIKALLRNVRGNRNIHKLFVGFIVHKLSAYGDNTLFYISDLLITLSNLMVYLKEFRVLLNFKIHFSKSKILPYV